MNIDKLTITPLISGYHNLLEIKNPTIERAGLLMKEKLRASHINGAGNSEKGYHRPLPKFLKGFINPKSLVTENLNKSFLG